MNTKFVDYESPAVLKMKFWKLESNILKLNLNLQKLVKREREREINTNTNTTTS